jgi:hypothetical protein
VAERKGMERDADVARIREQERRHREKIEEEDRLRREQLAAEKLRADQEKLAAAKAAELAALNPPPDQVVVLNVGGTRFTTSRAVLTKYPESVLGVMFSETSRKLEVAEDGSVFLDANPALFGHILNWLRRGTLPELSAAEVRALKEEANVWGLRELLQELEKKR